MMHNPYDVHSFSKQYRNEALEEARSRQLERQLRENRRPRSERGTVVFALSHVLALLRGG
jgi:hypothetical protein